MTLSSGRLQMDRERILEKIGELERYIAELNDVLPLDEESYIQSTKEKRATERILQIAIECVIDICAILLKALELGPPANEDKILELLEGHLTMVETVKTMKRFRNILVHKYGIVKDNLVFEYASNRQADFRDFIDEVRTLMANLHE